MTILTIPVSLRFYQIQQMIIREADFRSEYRALAVSCASCRVW